MSCSQSLEPFKLRYLNVTKKLRVDLIEPLTDGGSIIIDGLDLACITLNDVNTLVGCGAGAAVTTGSNNTLLGVNAGNALTIGNFNTIVGFEAGLVLTVASNNTILGTNAGESVTSGSSNVLVGRLSGQSLTTGDNNTSLGANSGDSITTGASNTLVGKSAGDTIKTGSDNVMIGEFAGRNSSSALTGCVLIGTAVGLANVTDNRLMIDNSNTTTPLIDGDFSGDTIQFNGVVTLGQSGNITNVHRINGSVVNGSSGANGDYLVVNINNTNYKLPLHNV